jgi:hypothetical protein
MLGSFKAASLGDNRELRTWDPLDEIVEHVRARALEARRRKISSI